MSIEPGSTLAHYRLIEKIGEGGMGVVWRALDRTLDRQVAIKLLPPAFSDDPDRLARFEREAKTLAGLSHANIATIYGLHEQGGTSFIAMELIAGEDLPRRMAARKLTVHEALVLARQIAAALEATHDNGVIHRDLKPANIFVTPSGDVKVLDFGIAREILPEPVSGPADDSDGKTRAGSIIGTVSYMSPEQARGKSVDARTDLWSFGCVLYEMLCGHPVFRGETRWDKLAAVLREEPDWSALPDDTPDSVRELLGQLLQKDPGSRLSRAGDAIHVIDGVLGLATGPGEPLPSPGVSPRRVAAIVGGLFALLATLALWGLWGRGAGDARGVAEGADRRSIAVLPFESMGGGEDNEAFAAGIHADVLNRVAKIGDLRVISRASVGEYRRSDKPLEAIAAELGVATVLEGAVRREGEQVRINVELIDAVSAEVLWAEAYNRELSVDGIVAIESDIAGQIAGALEARLTAAERSRIDDLPTSDLTAYDLYLQGLEFANRPGEVEADLLAARERFGRAVQVDPSFALAFAELSEVARDHHWLGGGGDEALRSAVEAAHRAVELAPDLPEAHLALGTTHYVRRDYESALREFALAEGGLPGNARLIRWKAFIMRRRGGFEQALVDLARAQALDPREPLLPEEIGFSLLCLRRYDEAAPRFEEALALAPEYPFARMYRALIPVLRDGSPAAALSAAREISAAPPGPWRTAMGWRTLVWAGEYEQALKFIEGQSRATGQWMDYPISLLTAQTHLLLGDPDQARREFDATRVRLEQDIAVRPQDARLHAALGLAYAGLGLRDAGIAAGRRAVELMPVEQDVFTGGWLLQELAWIQAGVGQVEGAVATLDRLLAMPGLTSIEVQRLDPLLAALHDQPGFLRLVARYGSED